MQDIFGEDPGIMVGKGHAESERAEREDQLRPNVALLSRNKAALDALKK